jgi:hypothetical protein
MSCARGVWDCRDYWREACRVVGLVLDSPDDERIRAELCALAVGYLRAWRTVEHSLALDDAYGLMDGEAQTLRQQAAMLRGVLSEIAPPPSEKPADASAWGAYSATAAIGADASRRKLLAVVGRAVADGLEPSLARRLAHLENERSSIPPLPSATVDQLADWCLQRHMETAR